MKVLAIDTSTEILSVGLETESGHFETSIAAGLRHSEFLLPAVDALTNLASCGKRFDLVVCMRGPGSFTGLRIGMATSKGLSAASGCPLAAVSTLDVLAFGYDYFAGYVVPVIDARKRRVYAAIYEAGLRVSEDLDVAPADLLDRLDKSVAVLFTGPGAHLVEGQIHSRNNCAIDPRCTSSRAAALLQLGKRRFEEVGPEPPDAGPVYLRESEAERGK